jgi:peptidoglycan/xylan/chitin deacetylase (PgdA/CDA1 family)
MDPSTRRSIRLAGAGGALAGASAFLSWAVRGRSSTFFGDSVWRGSRAVPALALTFDDGPSESTPEVLDVLARHNVPATFFQIGANVERLPAITREVRSAGHSIGNHGYEHSLYCFRAPRTIEEDLRLAQEAIQDHAGVRPVWFRAPFGARWFGLKQVQRRLGLVGVMWTVIGYDWKRKPDEVVARMLRLVSNGAILCLHDGRELRVRPDIRATVEAVRRLVPMLLDRGYKFETISRLLCPTN